MESEVNITTTKILSEKQKIDVVRLWNNEYPKELSHPNLSEFDQYLQGLSDLNHILLSDENENVRGWLIYFIRNNEQCFAMLIDSSLQGQGWGSKLLSLAKECNSELNGWVINNNNELKQNGESYKSPVSFIERTGLK